MNKLFVNYKEAKKQLKAGTYNLLNDSFGQVNNGIYSTDLTIRDYDGEICIDFDVYEYQAGTTAAIHKDGGLICKVKNLPFTEKGFWKLANKKIDTFIKELK